MREEQLRRAAVRFANANPKGTGVSDAARQLGVSSRTLGCWKKNASGRQRLPSRGRPPVGCSQSSRNSVIRFLNQVTGPCISVASLRCLFPDIRPCVLSNLLTRYRRVWKQRYARRGYRLTWHKPGRVWAMDHSQASHPIDGVFPQILAVRDLSSHRQLAWAPCVSTGAEEAVSLIQELFSRHGPPLVLKSDNGSAFISEWMRKLTDDWGVAPLFNPPRHPQYNGALERSNGTLKVYTQQHAVREGHPFRWTSENLDRARTLANEITRPWGHRGKTPQQAWQSRDRISLKERCDFHQSVQKHRIQAGEDLGFTYGQSLDKRQQAQLDRLAITRALEELGYLTIKRAHRREKPKRVSRQQAAQLANDIAGNVTSTATDSRGRPGNDDRRRWQKKSGTKRLATDAQRGTMLASDSNHSVQNESVDVPPVKRMQAFFSWPRRIITPLISFAKSANIKH